MILHTLSALPSSAAFDDCVRVVHSDDAIVLMGDGVYAALDETHPCTKLQATGAELYLLATDATAAGVTKIVSAASSISMDDFVALTERFPRQQAWY